MNCKYYAQHYDTCTNDICPYCEDLCPVHEHQEVCKYARKPIPETNLEGKCGSCEYASQHYRKGRAIAYINCSNKHIYKDVHSRTQRCCEHYKRRKDDGTEV